MNPTYDIEKKLIDSGYPVVVGLDEAGAGVLFGNVTAAACYIPENNIYLLECVNDSKKLTSKKREYFFELIKKYTIYGIATIEPNVIDKINILEARKLAMLEAAASLELDPSYLIIDGNSFNLELDTPYENIVKGDSKSLSIACASILAKVTRDNLMIELDKKFPEYGIASHKGYGTKKHKEAIAKYGPCDLHRKTFKGVKEYV